MAQKVSANSTNFAIDTVFVTKREPQEDFRILVCKIKIKKIEFNGYVIFDTPTSCIIFPFYFYDYLLNKRSGVQRQ